MYNVDEVNLDKSLFIYQHMSTELTGRRLKGRLVNGFASRQVDVDESTG